MEKIESFKINHMNLMPGLYVSRRDKSMGCTVTTFDLRITAPNREPVIDMPALHTIEHMAATFLRNSERKEDIVYFGPMGCRTGCYLLMFGDLNSQDILRLVIDMCDFIIAYDGEMPGASDIECGNYRNLRISSAQKECRVYLEQVKEWTTEKLQYPN